MIKIYPDNPSQKEIDTVVSILKNGGIIIYPTDSLYAFGCDITQPKAVEKICQLKNLDLRKVPLSFICSTISHVSEYARFDNTTFALLKTCLPGAFTFLLNGSKTLPRLFKKKSMVGIRIPDNKIALEIVKTLGNPLLSTSIFINEDEPEYSTDPELIAETYEKRVDCIIDGGYGGLEPSTIIDCTGNAPFIKRKGKGIVLLND